MQELFFFSYEIKLYYKITIQFWAQWVLNGSWINRKKNLQLGKTYNDFLETNNIGRKVQKVPKIWRLEHKHGSPATMELCSITKIIKKIIQDTWHYSGNTLLKILNLCLHFSLIDFLLFLHFSCFVIFLICSHISPLFYFLRLFPILPHV